MVHRDSKVMQSDIKEIRSDVQHIKDFLNGNQRTSNIFLMAPPGQFQPQRAPRMRELSHPNYAREEDTEQPSEAAAKANQRENVRQQLAPIMSVLNEAMSSSAGDRGRVININLITLNQTRNKIATHNQTLKVNKNAPTLHQHQHRHSGDGQNASQGGRSAFGSGSDSRADADERRNAEFVSQEKKRPRTSIFQRNSAPAPKRQKTSDSVNGWKDSMCDW